MMYICRILHTTQIEHICYWLIFLLICFSVIRDRYYSAVVGVFRLGTVNSRSNPAFVIKHASWFWSNLCVSAKTKYVSAHACVFLCTHMSAYTHYLTYISSAWWLLVIVLWHSYLYYQLLWIEMFHLMHMMRMPLEFPVNGTLTSDLQEKCRVVRVNCRSWERGRATCDFF